MRGWGLGDSVFATGQAAMQTSYYLTFAYMRRQRDQTNESEKLRINGYVD